MRHLPFLTILVISIGLVAWNLKLEEDPVTSTVWAGARPDDGQERVEPPLVMDESTRLVAPLASAGQAEERVALLVGEQREDQQERPVLGGGSGRARPAGTEPGGGFVVVLETHSQGTSVGSRTSAGARTGLWKDTWPDGTLRSVGEYVADEREGEWEFFYEDGTKQKEGAYSGGLREGLWTTWHPNGERMQAATFQQGRMDGYWQEWFSNGQVKEAGRYLNGRREGWWQFFHFDGAVDVRTGTYESGRHLER